MKKQIVWKDLWSTNVIDGYIESQNKLFRLLILILFPLKFFILVGLAAFIMTYLFSFFGLMFILDDFIKHEHLTFISYFIIVVDLIILILGIIYLVFKKRLVKTY
jgi:hypothetical protein